MSRPLYPEVVAETKRRFKSPWADEVLEKLASSEFPMERMGPAPRIQIAVLQLSKGDPAKFERELANAMIDWRDTLVAARLANENWREKLAKRGIDATHWH